jgi:hypothetical protein
MFDGWTNDLGDELVAIIAKIKDEIFLVDLATTKESKDAFWYA